MFSPDNNEDTAIAIKLLSLFKDATDSVRIILNVHLSASCLSKIKKFKDKNVIEKIDSLLEEVLIT
ncbi:hypothetical protein F9Y90_04470 (plasmid) [Borrelia miyamotoi]|uniref:Uncharacterized protein n=1 Tax=Borrelia miyamotoi TaxID=47466 RepID=A0AAX3JN82_9SPIR|nr:hypothetical protein [Borrelia miyamotoi]QFP42368.1 hypothetical protein F9Y90_04470 [Borrelia miyamotoi]QFP48489.1 hypothetical protein F9Y91_04455 [Borrelia miyamotoi]WAZ72390.1 hypothetical protein O5404_05050 [Borrelia miyamotoi]